MKAVMSWQPEMWPSEWWRRKGRERKEEGGGGSEGREGVGEGGREGLGRKNTQVALVCKLALIDFQFAILVYTFEHLLALISDGTNNADMHQRGIMNEPILHIMNCLLNCKIDWTTATVG